jgi:hypothetical protein
MFLQCNTFLFPWASVWLCTADKITRMFIHILVSCNRTADDMQAQPRLCMLKYKQSCLSTPQRQRGGRGIAPLILNPGTIWRRVVKLTAQAASPRKRTQVPIKQKAVGPWGGLGVGKNRKISFSCRESNPGSSTPQPFHYTDWAIPVP